VEVHTEPGRGTCVKVYLPRIDQAQPVEAGSPPAKARRGSETILLVEDDEMVRNVVREALIREGYRLMDSADPLEAQGIAEKHRGRIHLLITDVVMPKVSGRELADAIVDRRPDTRVLFMSGYTDTAIVNSGILDREAAFLQKPFTPAALVQKVRDVLEGADGMRLRASESSGK
jgi:DNA-binding NtrC family response regulator